MKPRVLYSVHFGDPFEDICAMRAGSKFIADGVIYHLNHKDKEHGLIELIRKHDRTIIHVKRGDPMLRELRRV